MEQLHPLRDEYKDNPIIPEGLDLLQEDDQIAHQISLEDDLQVRDGLSTLKNRLFGQLTLTCRSQMFSRPTPTSERTRRSIRKSRPKFLEAQMRRTQTRISSQMMTLI